MSIEEIFTCILCPKGCELTAEGSGDSLKVSGNACKRGEAFAKEELESPVRTLTTTVRTVFASFPRLPVRTSKGIPLASFQDAMAAINSLLVTESVRCGDIVAGNFPGIDADIIATSDIDAWEK